MPDAMNDREFVEYVRSGIGLGSRSIKAFDRIRQLATPSYDVSLPDQEPSPSWKWLVDIATLRLDLQDARAEIERWKADREDDKRIITELKSERDAAEMILESTRQLARDSVERALDQ